MWLGLGPGLNIGDCSYAIFEHVLLLTPVRIYLIEYLSQGITLQKGSVIMTGTPGGMYALEQPTAAHSTDIMARYLGVGNGMKPPQFLAPGTVMEVIVSKIGTLRNGVEFA